MLEMFKLLILKRVDHLSRYLHQHQQALELLDNIRSEAVKAYVSLPAHRRLQQATIMERQGQLMEAIRYIQMVHLTSVRKQGGTYGQCN